MVVHEAVLHSGSLAKYRAAFFLQVTLLKQAAEKIFRTDDIQVITRTIAFTENRLASGKAVASPVAYFMKALRERWAVTEQPAKSTTKLIPSRKSDSQLRPQPAIKLTPPPADAASALSIADGAAAAAVDSPMPWLVNYEAYLQLPEARQTELLEAYKAMPGNPFAQEVKKNGLFKKLVRVHFGQCLGG